MTFEGEDIDHAVKIALVRFGSRITIGIYSLLVVAIGVSFGGGVWVTDVRTKLVSMESSLSKLEQSTPRQWAVNQLMKDLGHLDEDLESLEKRLSALERSRLDGRNGGS